jgi:hypothetical protein
MPTIEVSADDLLNAVKQMSPDEFNTFIDKAVALRARSSSGKLSAAEQRLVERINRGLPNTTAKRYNLLIRRRRKQRLTPVEHEELLRLTHEAESQDVDRVAALAELAELRGVPLRVVMKQLVLCHTRILG